MSVGEAKAGLRRGITSAGLAKQIIESVATEAMDTAHFTQHTVHDSEHPEVTKGLACLKAATDELELVVRRLDTSAKAADEYQATLG
ncbi:hypothetical protein [Plantactinospora sp. B5E13]|uniref:hypothetical protein n=1 Tax=Plantactinospora sp. B5E13 TaxID=3153758 RepID=UPI00325D0303